SSLRQAAMTRSVNRACARMLMAMRALSIRLMSSASSSAPRAVKTRVSPTLRQRSCAGVPSKTDGKSSGTQMVTGDFASALILYGVGERRLRGRHPGSGLTLVSEIAQGQLERRQGGQNVLRAGGHGHRADAERRRPHLVQPGTDENAVLIAHARHD